VEAVKREGYAIYVWGELLENSLQTKLFLKNINRYKQFVELHYEVIK